MDCINCEGLCCRFFPIEISYEEYAIMKLEHEVDDSKIKIIEKNNYRRLFLLPPCQFLTTDYRCIIYESRPNICRLYPIIAKQENFRAEFFCPKIKDLVDNNRLNELESNMRLGIKLVRNEILSFADLEPSEQQIKIESMDYVNIEVAKLLDSYITSIPKNFDSSHYCCLNSYKDIPQLKEYFSDEKK